MKKYNPVNKVLVKITYEENLSHVVGRMLLAPDKTIYFEYDKDFLKQKTSLSPHKLKTDNSAQRPASNERFLFDGLFGVFADSLPDGWGLTLMDRGFRKLNASPENISALDRLCWIGKNGMGALTYEPEIEKNDEISAIDLAILAESARGVLEGSSRDVLPELLLLGGSPGGARPKILVGVSEDKIISGVDLLPKHFEHWMIKFLSPFENKYSSLIEYAYAKTAEKIGLRIEPTRLFNDKKGNHWFGIRRFDRKPENKRIHVHSLAGLLHTDFRAPTLDYQSILAATHALTRNKIELEMSFRYCCFNVFYNNRDDHAKNFSFTLNANREWQISPAYDLTFSLGPGGEHTTTILGEGKNPTPEHLKKLGKQCGLDDRTIEQTIDEVISGKDFLKELLKNLGVPQKDLVYSKIT